MKISNILIYCAFNICLLFAFLTEVIDNNTYFICMSIMLSAYLIGTEIGDKNIISQHYS